MRHYTRKKIALYRICTGRIVQFTATKHGLFLHTSTRCTKTQTAFPEPVQKKKIACSTIYSLYPMSSKTVYELHKSCFFFLLFFLTFALFLLFFFLIFLFNCIDILFKQGWNKLNPSLCQDGEMGETSRYIFIQKRWGPFTLWAEVEKKCSARNILSQSLYFIISFFFLRPS